MINESILNEEVMKYNKNKTDHMKYLPAAARSGKLWFCEQPQGI